MQPRIPRPTVHEPVPPTVDDVAGFSAELVAAVAGARRRAVRSADRQIDSAHLLHSLLESDAEVRGMFGEEPRISRVLGYLVQRSIGYGLRWQGGVEDSGEVPVVAVAEGFSPVAAVAVEGARVRAVRRGVALAEGVDLLAAVLADPRSRAVEVLGRAGVDAGGVVGAGGEGGGRGRGGGGVGVTGRGASYT
ncbi:Clp protease N-terminal domain-containing protein [Streptomyces acidiscabies]|uniref:Clp protease N-terminal domain-containing protein n=1 Tax=Streptomyces acidiscabies TaxID=42234 RepID=UPI003F5E87B5